MNRTVQVRCASCRTLARSEDARQPTGTSGTPTRPAAPRSPAARTPAPPRRGPATGTASPTSGSTSPRPPICRQQHAHFATPTSAGSGLGQRFCGTTRVLPQAPRVRHILKVERSGYSPFPLSSAVGWTTSSRRGGAPRTTAPLAQEDLPRAYGRSRGTRSSSLCSARPGRTSSWTDVDHSRNLHHRPAARVLGSRQAAPASAISC